MKYFIADFPGIGGDPYDNALLAAALNTKGSLATLPRFVDNFISDADLILLEAGNAVDITYAYNLCSQADVQPWTSDLQYKVVGSRYANAKVNDTVYIRVGQVLDGMNTFWDCTDNTDVTRVKYGWGLVGAVPTADPQGPYGGVVNLRATGGSGGGVLAFIDVTDVAGFFLDNIGLSSPGVAINIDNSSDGNIGGIWIDQCLSAFVFTDSQNINMARFYCFIANYGITYAGANQSINVNSGVICYTQYSSVLVSALSVNSNCLINDILFDMNVQYGTFTGHIQNQGGVGNDISFNSCQFRNWPGYCIRDLTGIGAIYRFNNCVFDATKTDAGYAQSVDAAVIETGYGNYYFNDCEYRDLLGSIASITSNLQELNLCGGEVFNCPEDRFIFVSSGDLNITVQQVKGFAFYKSNAGYQMFVLPWWGPNTAWDVGAKGNTAAGGDGNYSRMETGIVALSWAYTAGVKYVYCDYTKLWETPARDLPSNLLLEACLGNTQGGATSTNVFADSGKVCISSPTAAGSNYAMSASTIN